MSINFHKKYIFSASAPLHKPSDDPYGNLLTNGVFTYAYDADNRLASVSSSGFAIATYAYDAFGNVIGQPGAMADSFPYRFSTKYLDTETGLYYYGYRFYKPEIMCWLTEDPTGEERMTGYQYQNKEVSSV